MTGHEECVASLWDAVVWRVCVCVCVAWVRAGYHKQARNAGMKTHHTATGRPTQGGKCRVKSIL